MSSAPVKAIEQSGESPDQSSRYSSEVEGNCVFMRKGGEQLETKEQSVTKVNSIRPNLSGSVLLNREPLTSRNDPDEPNTGGGEILQVSEATRTVNKQVTCQTEASEMVIRWLETECSEVQSR